MVWNTVPDRQHGSSFENDQPPWIIGCGEDEMDAGDSVASRRGYQRAGCRWPRGCWLEIHYALVISPGREVTDIDFVPLRGSSGRSESCAGLATMKNYAPWNAE